MATSGNSDDIGSTKQNSEENKTSSSASYGNTQPSPAQTQSKKPKAKSSTGTVRSSNDRFQYLYKEAVKKLRIP